MRSVFRTLLFPLAVLLAGYAAAEAFGADRPTGTPRPAQAGLALKYGNIPLIFEPNQGQTDARVKFLSRGRGYTLFLTSGEAVWVLPLPAPADARRPVRRTEPTPPRIGGPVAQTALRMRVVGASRSAQVLGLEELPGKSNYFIGNDPAKWHTNIPQYAKVQYRGIYPGVDLVYYGNGGQVEMDFVVAPGVDPGVVTLDFQGARSLQLDAQGDLVIDANGREVRLHKPRIFQEGDGSQQIIAGGYVLKGKGRVEFTVGNYDRTRRLVIDPRVSYATYLGGINGTDSATAIAVDASGNAYVAGGSSTNDFPTTPGAFMGCSSTGCGPFVTKFNASGSALIYSTLIAGAFFRRMVVDAEGNAYLTGRAQASLPTTPGAFQASPPPGKSPDNGNAFALKLSPTGSTLVYSTFLTGSGDDAGAGIAVDASGSAYVTGFTASFDFPLANPLQPSLGGGLAVFDAFVTKLNATGSMLIYSTYLGGAGSDQGHSIAVDSSGNAYATGHTASSDFPTSNPLQPNLQGTGDAFVAKFNPAGSALLYSTYLGGSSSETLGGFSFGAIAVDSGGHAYVAGSTGSVDFPTVGAFQPNLQGESDVFVGKLDPAGSSLIYSTYLGGLLADSLHGMAVDGVGNVYVVGFTQGGSFPQVSPFLPFLPGAPFHFLAALNQNGSGLVYSSPIGGSILPRIVVDTSGNVYVAGLTLSGLAFEPPQPFPTTPGAFDTEFRNNGDAFVAKVENVNAPALAFIASSLDFGDQPVNTTSSFSKPVTLVDAGSVALGLTSITVTGDFSETNNCGSGLAPAGSCIVRVSFTPTVAGPRTGELIIADDVSSNPLILSLSGNGAAPAVALSTNSLAFGNLVVGTTSTPQAVTLTNSGSVTLNLGSVAVSGDFAQTNNCSLTLAPGASCTLNVTFTPTATGTRNGVMSITDNAAGSPHQVALSGTGIVDFSLNLSLAIATVTAGGSTTTTITINPQGGSFDSAISFSCSGLPARANCSFSPSSLTPGSSTASTTLTITTTAPSTALLLPPGQGPHSGVPVYALWLPLLGLAWTGAGLASMKSNRRKQDLWLVVGLTIVLLSALAGCGGGSQAASTPPTLIPGTPPGSYSVTVNATSGSLVHTTTFTLVVQ